MTTQPEALRLADLLDERPHDALDFLPTKAAAELRRLQEENDAAHQVGIQQEGDLMKVEAQRDALLEALRAAVADWDEEVSRGRWLDAARAAIAKAEEA